MFNQIGRLSRRFLSYFNLQMHVYVAANVQIQLMYTLAS